LDRLARAEIEAAIDAEVLQEILHRYRAIRRWKEGRTVYDLARRLFPLVYPVSVQVLDAARSLLDRHQGLTARDALHAAVVHMHELTAICSYDTDFDRIEGVHRVEPAHV
jgi:predicted nucleic acid-binding protein